jgi:hypothetical protein
MLPHPRRDRTFTPTEYVFSFLCNGYTMLTRAVATSRNPRCFGQWRIPCCALRIHIPRRYPALLRTPRSISPSTRASRWLLRPCVEHHRPLPLPRPWTLARRFAWAVRQEVEHQRSRKRSCSARSKWRTRDERQHRRRVWECGRRPPRKPSPTMAAG